MTVRTVNGLTVHAHIEAFQFGHEATLALTVHLCHFWLPCSGRELTQPARYMPG